MIRLLLFISLFLCLDDTAFSQQNWQAIRRKGYETLVYRIPADTAEKYLKKGIREIDHYLQQEPVLRFHADSVHYSKIPTGNYLILSVADSMINARYYCKTPTLSYIINNEVQPQLLLRDEAGTVFSNANVEVNGKPAKFNPASSTYLIADKKPQGAFIRIELPGDTSFVEVEMESENYKTVREQRMARFRATKTGKIITWLPDRMKRWFAPNKKKRSKNIPHGKGYVIFNKPKYYPSDTIRFKAYLVDRKDRQFKKELETWLVYTNKNASINRKLADLRSVSAGAYVYEFATGDTLPNDTRYTVQFRTKKGKTILSGFFKIEDYLLNEVATYSIRSRQDNYAAGDTLEFYAAAKDANGLAVMDGRVELLLVTKQIGNFYKERVFVPDTIWKQEKALAVEGETPFSIPTNNFPSADIDVKAIAIFRNSNNEILQEEKLISYNANNSKIDIRLENGWIKATLYRNGKPVPGKGFMETDLAENEVPVVFPFSVRLDPQVEEYNFYTEDDELDEYFEPENYYRPVFNRLQDGDTVAFLLNNPQRVPIYYSVFDKDKTIFSASSDEENIVWKNNIPLNKIYYLRWQYYWKGRQYSGNENLALLNKLASAEIGGADAVYPGQTDTITVKVKDYKQRELKNVNLTAVSYNNQFAADIRVPEPPYIQKFRGYAPILYDRYETSEVLATAAFSLGKHQAFRKLFHLDTMPYYRLLFPEKHYQMVKTRIAQILPQVAVYVVQNGTPQEVYMVYMNREFVYFNGVTDKSSYATTRYPGFAQFVIRLKNKYIEADSIYLQPYYKHDIVFDLDKQGANYKVRDTVDYWTSQEKQVLNNQLLRIENNHRNNGGYVWQDEKAYFLGHSKEHVVGPFVNYDSIQFYKPGDFDFTFNFEPGYRYRVSPQMVRLEKIPYVSFTDKVKLNSMGAAWWPLGDTIKEIPIISYTQNRAPLPFLEADGLWLGNRPGIGKIQLQMPLDSTIIFTVLQNNNDENDYRIAWGNLGVLNNVAKGNYTAVLVTRGFHYLQATNIEVGDSAGTYCAKFEGQDSVLSKPVYRNTNNIIAAIRRKQAALRMKREADAVKKNKEQEKKNELYKQPAMKMPYGTGAITGKVFDKKGKDAIPWVSVTLKGYTTGAVTVLDGQYQLKGIKAGQYILQFSAPGYMTLEKKVTVYEGMTATESAELEMNNHTMAEVVVTALGQTRQAKELAYSVSKISASELTLTKMVNLNNGLSGKVSGLNVDTDSRSVFADTRITLRGIRSLTADNEPMLIIDGVPADKKMLSELNPNDISSTSILKSAEATAIYGAAGANGALIITTKAFQPKMLREEFRDYAFWKPNLITDENGEVKFTVAYPDNITSWQTYVVGMDKQHHITRASKLVKSFKPMLAQLAMPQFLVEGDSSFAIGKQINYTSSPIKAVVDFHLNEQQKVSSSVELKPNESAISEFAITAAPGEDTISARFSLRAENGFADGEQRKIPVFKKGVTESVGQFTILKGDARATVTAHSNGGPIKIYAQNNTIDVLLDEINHLKNYPYYCMEQTASKLTGLALERKIRESLKQDFSGQKEMNKLLDKLQKGQLFDGSWSWWPSGSGNATITNYVTRALLQLPSDALLKNNIRNALLYLNNQLPGMNKQEMLETLLTLSEAGHDMDYSVFLKRLEFDSLTQHQQWQVLAIANKQKLGYEKELHTVLNQKKLTMFGAAYFGEQGYWWNRNEIATTVLAYKTLAQLREHTGEQEKMLQYFLEQRGRGHWRNTVESATILAAIVPDLLKQNQQFPEKANLYILGDTSISVNEFPFAATLKPGATNIQVSKQGGGMVYFTAYQQVFNPSPTVVDSNFKLVTRFEDRNGNPVMTLKAGERAILKLEVEAVKDAEYVQLEIPVPAGCTFGSRQTGLRNEYREYFRDRVLIFAEQMNKGKHVYTIELEPRYTGRYVLNPAKAELMYFPVFFGRTGIDEVNISK